MEDLALAMPDVISSQDSLWDTQCFSQTRTVSPYDIVLLERGKILDLTELPPDQRKVVADRTVTYTMGMCLWSALWRRQDLHMSAESVHDSVLEKLAEFATLPDGWDYGDGGPTLPHVSTTARRMYQDLRCLAMKADAFPCADGSLSLVFYVAQRSADIHIAADGTIDLSVEEDGEGQITELLSRENVSEYYAKTQVLRLFLGQELSLWDSSGLFIPDTMTKPESDHIATASLVQAAELEFLSSTLTVSNRQKHRFANISPAIIQR